MKRSLALAFFITSAVLVSHAALATGKIALVYNGVGACSDGCYQSAALMAEQAGFTVRYVGPEESSPEIFKDAAIWLQPGGKSSQASKAMVEPLKDNIRTLVKNGGAYVGFCAGGFLATKEIAKRKVPGLGLIPGTNAPFETEVEALQLPIAWMGKFQRSLYFEGGPYFMLPEGETSAWPAAHYADGKIAAVQALYGEGRVFVTGPHPEAPQEWREAFGFTDEDGMDHDLAVDMIKWATKLTE